jgi:hypothetical protein
MGLGSVHCVYQPLYFCVCPGPPQELCQEVPGLFSLGPKGELLVGEARQHEKQLEKVREPCTSCVVFA